MAGDTDEAGIIECETHGSTSVTAIVCCHQVRSKTPVGFVENNDDPEDRQAWCDACEALYLNEGSLTQRFREYCDIAVVCGECYADIKRRHSKRSHKPRWKLW